MTSILAVSLILLGLTMIAMASLPSDTRKVGGIRFVKLGRLTMSYSVSRAFRPIKAPAPWMVR